MNRIRVAKGAIFGPEACGVGFGRELRLMTLAAGSWAAEWLLRIGRGKILVIRAWVTYNH